MRITYKIDISCDVSSKGIVVPSGSSIGIVGEDGKALNMLDWPEPEKIMQIHIGKFYMYPLKKSK